MTSSRHSRIGGGTVGISGWTLRWLVVGSIAFLLDLALNARGAGDDGRFGGVVRAQDLAGLDPGARLDRVQVELERRAALHQPLVPAGHHLLVAGRLEAGLDQRWFKARDPRHAGDLEALAAAYAAFGLESWAGILRRAAQPGADSADLHRRWVAAYQARTSRQARITYLESHLPEILP